MKKPTDNQYGIVLTGLMLIVLLAFVVVPLPLVEDTYALVPWDSDARAAAPPLLRLWLGGMGLVFFCSLVFVRRHVAARWVVPLLLASSGATTLVGAAGLAEVTGGLVSTSHILFWTPFIYMIYRYRDEVILPSAYGIWAVTATVVYAISMFFDVRDAIIWIGHMIA